MTKITMQPIRVTDQGRNAPISHHARWYKCDSCENLHVVLCSEDDSVIATMTLDYDMLNSMHRTIDED
jgi:hypothetical protein